MWTMTTFAGTAEMIAEQQRGGVGGLLRHAWRINAPLTATGLLMLGSPLPRWAC